FRSLPELLSVVNHDPAVTARFGHSSRQMVRRDEERGGRLRRTLRDEHGFTERMQVAARQKVAPTRGRTSAPATRGVDVRGMARELARRVEGIDPTPQRLEKILADLRAEHRGFRDRRRVDFMISTYGGVFPALRRWNFKKGRQFSPRYVARLMSLIHEAGPDADFDQVLEQFRQTEEFAEDGRLPPLGTRFTFDHAPTYRGLIAVWRHRKDFQKTRILLETVRTAPSGMSLKDIVNERLPVSLSASGARVMLRNLTAAKVAALDMSPAVLERLRRNNYAGLGEAVDPSFDGNHEPPGVDMELVNDVLDMPRAGPAMQHFIKRLDGRRPFAGHRTLFVYHQYSDIVPLMELFIDAGMSAKRARFVKTAYPFKDTVRRNLDFLGVETIEHAQSVPALRDAIAKGLEELLSHNEPILIIDDGGLASSVLRERFPDQIDRVKIFEITEAGHRQADHERRELGRYPVVYGSKARLPVKKQVTSAFHAKRVVAKLEALLPQTGLDLPHPKIAVIGAGAMGLPAYKELVRIYRRRGVEVVVVESDRLKAAALARKGITVEDRATALSTSGLILGMTGGSVGEDGKVVPILGPEDLALLPDGVILAQGSSKQNEFDMAGFARVAARKRELPRTDGLPQKSFTYDIRTGRKTKRLHFLGDGWTLNHDGSLHGTPIADLDLELGVLLEGAAMVADTRVGRTVNAHLEVDEATQDEYGKVWRARQAR
ncbi:MAG TPA: hypothetical protein VMZ28_23075, partial [Kofleriaceae bacterium]|nr:hypothetical protein [Kofleriaceae bacterium]